MLNIKIVAILSDGVILELPDDPGPREDIVDEFMEFTAYLRELTPRKTLAAHKWTKEEFRQLNIDPEPLFKTNKPPGYQSRSPGSHSRRGLRDSRPLSKPGRYNYLFVLAEDG